MSDDFQGLSDIEDVDGQPQLPLLVLQPVVASGKASKMRVVVNRPYVSERNMWYALSLSELCKRSCGVLISPPKYAAEGSPILELL